MSYVIMGTAKNTNNEAAPSVVSVFYAGRKKWSTLIENAKFFSSVGAAKDCINSGLPRVTGLVLLNKEVEICEVLLSCEKRVTLPKMGKWDDFDNRYICSECKCVVDYAYNFCPSCGMRMFDNE